MRGPARRRLIASVVLALTLVLVVYGIAVARPLAFPERLAIIAHAGDTSAGPENSLAALLAARDGAADGLEFDVNRSSDGTWWLFHNDQLDYLTTGMGRIQERTDAELEQLRMTAGLGFDRARDTDVRLVRLADALDALDDYRGTMIVDCKDTRPGSHTDLARFLLAHGDRPTVIARSVDLAGEVKAVDPAFTTITLQLALADPRSDVWLRDANTPYPPLILATDLTRQFGVFSARERWPQDERPLLDNAHRWGASFFISNDLADALAWRDGD